MSAYNDGDDITSDNAIAAIAYELRGIRAQLDRIADNMECDEVAAAIGRLNGTDSSGDTLSIANALDKLVDAVDAK